MMKGWTFFLLAAGGFLSSCHTYTPPPAALLGTSMTEENTVESMRIYNGKGILSLKRAKELSAANNPDFLSILQMVEAARMRYYQSLGAYAPEVRMGVRTGQDFLWAYDEHNPPMTLARRSLGYGVESTFGASWLLFDGFARYLTTQIQKSELRKESAVGMRVLCMLKRSVAYAYFDLQYAREVKRIQNANLAFQKAFENTVAPETKKGLRPEDELINFGTLSESAENSILSAVDKENTANYSLSFLMGYPAGLLPDSTDFEPFSADLRPGIYSVESCIEIALLKNPDMHIMRQMLEVAKFNQYKSYSAFLPTAYADFGYTAAHHDAQLNGYKVDRSSFSTNELAWGIRAEYLLFNGFARYNAMRAAQASFASAQFDMARTYLQIVNDIRAAYSVYETTLRQAKIYRSLVPRAKTQRDLVADRYRNFKTSVDRLDYAQNYYVQTELLYASAVTDFKKSVAQLEAIMMTSLYGLAEENPSGYPEEK